MTTTTPAGASLRSFDLRYLAHTALLGLLLLCLSIAPARAQTAGGAGPLETAPPGEMDPYGRDSPEGTVEGFIDTLAADDLTRATVYLDLGDRRVTARPVLGRTLALQLRHLLDRGGSILPRARLSNAASGELDDGLEPRIERVGTLRGGDREVDLLLEQVEGKTGPIWLVASETLRDVPGLMAGDGQTLLDRWLPQPFVDIRIQGAPLGHWLALDGARDCRLLRFVASDCRGPEARHLVVSPPAARDEEFSLDPPAPPQGFGSPRFS